MTKTRYRCADRTVAIGLACLLTIGPAAATLSDRVQFAPIDTLVQARTCKQVRSCEEAVRLWCGGYRRADGDNDGIPCENVCRTKEQVDRIRREIGC